MQHLKQQTKQRKMPKKKIKKEPKKKQTEYNALKPEFKGSEVYKPKSTDWHKKIAQARGERWKQNVLAGRRDAMLNPSNIRLARVKQNILQSAIAQKLGISEAAFGAIERGRQKVKSDLAKQIALILSLPVKKLFLPVGKEKYLAVIRKQTI